MSPPSAKRQSQYVTLLGNPGVRTQCTTGRKEHGIQERNSRKEHGMIGKHHFTTFVNDGGGDVVDHVLWR